MNIFFLCNELMFHLNQVPMYIICSLDFLIYSMEANKGPLAFFQIHLVIWIIRNLVKVYHHFNY